MKSILENVSNKRYNEILHSAEIQKLENTAEFNKQWLIKHLNKHQRKLLLRMGDAKDLKTELCSSESFMAGFKMGVKIGYEVNKD